MGETMRVTVCELPQDWTWRTEIQDGLKAYLERVESDFLLLPEMGFDRWLPTHDKVDPDRWKASVERHLGWMERLGEWGVPMVAGTRPAIRENLPLNIGWVWTREAGTMDLHEKYYLPDEDGFYEATWYRKGNGFFNLLEINGVKLGFLICSELWFLDRAREYARDGIDLLLCPRATPDTTGGVWQAGGQAGAWVSGAYCLSSNFIGPIKKGLAFGGTAWVTEPERGMVLGSTSPDGPFYSVDIDPGVSRAAKSGYPRYVRE